MICCHCEEARSADVAIPPLIGTVPKNWEIATPVCALVRNDIVLFRSVDI